jgi:solute carrier family 25 phosphate transporter 23/24/25/41
MSYFSATMKVTQEGDVGINDDTIQGLGTAQRFLRFFFGSLFLVAHTPPYNPLPPEYTEAELEMTSPSTSTLASPDTLPPRPDDGKIFSPLKKLPSEVIESFGAMLIACVPNSGYFVAGGLAGIVSRTSTAPLDRLKVYLIAQTSVAEEAVVAAKHGNIAKAAINAWRPLATATKELWKAGGMRSLYAGKCIYSFRRGLGLTDCDRQRLECRQSDARIRHQIWLLRGKYTQYQTERPTNLRRLRSASSLRLKDTMTQQ